MLIEEHFPAIPLYSPPRQKLPETKASHLQSCESPTITQGMVASRSPHQTTTTMTSTASRATTPIRLQS